MIQENTLIIQLIYVLQKELVLKVNIHTMGLEMIENVLFIVQMGLMLIHLQCTAKMVVLEYSLLTPISINV